jgi:cyclomaltodextrinase
LFASSSPDIRNPVSTAFRGRFPEQEIRARVSDGRVHLFGKAIGGSTPSPSAFHWAQAASNPAPVDLIRLDDDHAVFTFPGKAPEGEYYFSRTLVAADGRACRAKTFVTFRKGRIRPFRLETDHAAWIDTAVIYGITPYIFVRNGRLREITRKLREIARLGINTIWLQPIFPNRGGGQGYDATDYFSINPALGTEDDFRDLMIEARRQRLRVLLDFALNHASIHHPLATAAAASGGKGEGIFQRNADRTTYHHCYRRHPDGYLYYFWEDMPNLDHRNPLVRDMLIAAGRHWIERFDVDGYRIDAAWGVSSRSPGFLNEWRRALKRVKPEILLLGEDKAVHRASFEAGLDAAYDWTGDPLWVSQWAWQTQYNPGRSLTLFNTPAPPERAPLLRHALTNGAKGYARGRKVFRYLENNDTARFLPEHGLPATRMAAALMFTLPGIPSIFNGQEIGSLRHPHETDQIFAADRPIRELDECELYPHYQALIRLRLEHPSLHGPRFEMARVHTRDPVVAFLRGVSDKAVLCLFNLGPAPAVAWIPPRRSSASPGAAPGAGYAEDLLETMRFHAEPSGAIRVPLGPYGYRILSRAVPHC